MKLKLDANGAVVLRDNKPVYVKDDGSEIEFDGAQAFAKISQLTGEAKGHRERAEAAEAKLGAFKDITDPDEAIKALQTVKNFKDKQLVDAGEVEKVRAEAIKALEDKYKPIVEERDRLNKQLDDELIGGAFARSKFIQEKVVVPPDLLQASFGRYFKREDGKVAAFNPDGSRIYSQKRPGELADFDEALEIAIGAYPHRDAILKGSGASGGGAHPSNGAGGSKTVTRAQFDAMDPVAKASAIKSGASIVD